MDANETAEEVTPVATPERRTLKKTLNDARIIIALLLGSVVGIFIGGWQAYGQVREVGATAAREVVKDVTGEVKALQTRTTAIEYNQTAMGADLKDVKVELVDVHGAVRGVAKDVQKVLKLLPKKEE